MPSLIKQQRIRCFLTEPSINDEFDRKKAEEACTSIAPSDTLYQSDNDLYEDPTGDNFMELLILDNTHTDESCGSCSL